MPSAPRTGVRLSLTIFDEQRPFIDDRLGLSGPRVGHPVLLGDLFADGFDPRYTGYEDVTHAVLYERLVRGPFSVEGALAIRVLRLALDSSIDDSSYLRIAVSLGGSHTSRRSLALTLFPLTSDRMRVGFAYRTSWGGSAIFFKPDPYGGFPSMIPNTAIDPGARLQYTDSRLALWVGVKGSAVLDQNPSVSEAAPVYAGLAGVSVEAILRHLRIELNGGYFDRSNNPLFYSRQRVTDVHQFKDAPVVTLGGAARVSAWSRLPPSLTIDYERYREDPTSAARYLERPVYSTGFSWLAQMEASVASTGVVQFEDSSVKVNQVGYSTALTLRAQLGHARLKLDAIARSLPMMLLDFPSLVPFQDLPMNSISTPSLLGSFGFDYFFERLGLTIGPTLAIDRPASFTPQGKTDVGFCMQGLCSMDTLIVRGPLQLQTLPALSDGSAASVGPVLVGKLLIRDDFAEAFTAILAVYATHDPNRTQQSTSTTGQSRLILGASDAFGFFLTLQARL